MTLAGIVTYFAGYNEQISGLKYILARRIWNRAFACDVMKILKA